MKKQKCFLSKLVLFVFIFFQVSYIFLVKLPTPVGSANFTNISDTLSNSRLSYRAGVTSGAANGSVITIDSSGNADNDTKHLFPKDTVCFAGPLLDGCYQQKTYSVVSVVNQDPYNTFNISPPLGETALGANDYVIATQSAIHTIAFTLASAVPSNGDIYITIPSIDHATQGNDGFPDTNSSVSTNGFDLNSLGTSNISVSSSGCDNNWTVAAVTAGDATNDHRIRIDRTTNSCAAGSTITVTIGDANKKLINPAPISGHTQGIADVYTINVKTRDGSDNTLDESNVKVAMIEGVLVSATIQETLTVTVEGVNSGTADICGKTTDVKTTATSVPWETIANFGSFLEAAQKITVSTNAVSGYIVEIAENDQMGRNGITCPGGDAGPSNNCIQDTICGVDHCDQQTAADWSSPIYYGLGYSLQNISGNDNVFNYNDDGSSFKAKQFPDLETNTASESAKTIMRRETPAASSQAYVCYRINIPPTQPAGYYFNRITYTATATF